MPILWRYLLSSYLRVFFLSVSSFAAVLFVLRFKEIARFAALSADGVKTGLFVLYQIPHVLPIAIPISALIASFLLFQRLSQSHELTALRALHCSFGSLLAPLLFMSLLFSCLNFSICAELAPYCRGATKALLYRNTGVNPLILLQRQQLARIKDTYLRLQVKCEGQCAKNFFCITYNEQSKRLHFLHIPYLSLKQEKLLGKDATLLAHFSKETGEAFDSTILEHQKTLCTSAPLLSQILKKKRPATETSALNCKQLNIQAQQGHKKGKIAWIEILRRYSLSASVFSFTLLGCAFGMQIGRTSSVRPLFWMCSWTLFVLSSYFLGKSVKSFPLIAGVAFLAPHPILWIASICRLRALNRGVL